MGNAALKNEPTGQIGFFRALASVVENRWNLMRRWQGRGSTFGGDRDMWGTLGYKKDLDIEDYRLRFARNAVARRIIVALPGSTWRGGGTLIEDENPQVDTEFELAFDALATRLKLWRVFFKADVLARLGNYSGILIGAGGSLNSELPMLSGPDDIKYMKPYAEDRLAIDSLVDNSSDERFGLVQNYRLKRAKNAKITAINEPLVHWTRVIHVAEDLEDDIYNPPSLECVWNLLDDLEKVTGGGAEAFWLRANQGMQFDIDKEVEFEEGEETKVDEEMQRFMHGMQRYFRSRGMKVNTLGSDVANFQGPQAAIIQQISSGTGIPQRILMGSERGELASTQDRDNWYDQVGDRREQFAAPNVINQTVDRFTKYRALPTPKQYFTRWSQLKSMDDGQRADLGVKYATINKNQGSIVITDDEIRDRALQMPAKTDQQKADEEAAMKAKASLKVPVRQADPTAGIPPAAPAAAA